MGVLFWVISKLENSSSLSKIQGYYCSSVTAHYYEFLIWCKANVILRVCEGPHSLTQSTELRFLCFPRQEVSLVAVVHCVTSITMSD